MQTSVIASIVEAACLRSGDRASSLSSLVSTPGIAALDHGCRCGTGIFQAHLLIVSGLRTCGNNGGLQH
jgi:hypothetical protein